MKKLKIIIGVLFLVILSAVGAFMLRYNQMAKTLTEEYTKIENIDLNKLADGVYPGVFGDFLVSVNLEVTVKDHRITGINIKEQNCGPGYEARDTVNRIIRDQSAKVDAVAGATGSSKCIMIAVHKALNSK